jgi:hypothetical protein
MKFNMVFALNYALKLLSIIGPDRRSSSTFPVLSRLANVQSRAFQTYDDGGSGAAVAGGVTETQVIVVPVTGMV